MCQKIMNGKSIEMPLEAWSYDEIEVTLSPQPCLEENGERDCHKSNEIKIIPQKLFSKENIDFLKRLPKENTFDKEINKSFVTFPRKTLRQRYISTDRIDQENWTIISFDKNKLKYENKKIIESRDDDDSSSSLSRISCLDRFILNVFSSDDEENSQHVNEYTEEETQTTDFFIFEQPENSPLAKPRILFRSLMGALRDHMPHVVQEENFYLKYSLERDGASMINLLSKTRYSPRSIIAIETIHGEIFGAFTSTPWRDNGNNYYGSGESFLWRLKNDPPTDKSFSSSNNCEVCGYDEANISKSKTRNESNINVEVFPWSGENRNVQLSNFRRLIVGGGAPFEINNNKDTRTGVESNKNRENDKNWSFGLMLDGDLLSGSSGCCVTFNSPHLSKSKGDGMFKVSNVEVWAMTAASTVEQAEQLEKRRASLFMRYDFVEA